ncbi:hypothetical protein H6G89_01305 [Oscillatoria sp. FACHB-1407]|uniref:hypothetical protein n=1 Tax=Oscillatoria sp. FACHB-1407 TaxID=2692847 RepID=UPI0016891181|nr:hypothetical protein [Oscillatoria sp. FACHB-1407]MBD2459667.1 hypothetical protein [Oscillatoria sp. FACHB-1407]
MYSNNSPSRWDDLLAMCANPLTRNLHEPILAYRITLPVIAHSLGLYGDRWSWRALLATPGLPYLALIGTLAIVYVVVQRQTNSTVAALTSLALSLTHLTQWTNTHWGHPDSITHLAIAVTMLSPNVWLTGVMTVLGSLNDERFVVAIPFVLLWYIATEPTPPKRIQASLKTIAGFAVGLVIVVLVRHALTVGWIGEGIERPAVYNSILDVLMNPWKINWAVFLTSLFLGYRWVWVVLGLALGIAWRKPYRWIGLGLGVAVLLASYFTITVADISRSTAFYFPAIAIAVWLLYRQSAILCYRALAVVSVACILTPGFYLFSFSDIQLYRPLPLVLVRLLTGWDILDLLR